MRVKKMRKLSLSERIALTLLATDIRKTVDADLGDLVGRIAAGDDTALVPAVDRLKELGREEQAEGLKRLVLK